MVWIFDLKLAGFLEPGVTERGGGGLGVTEGFYWVGAAQLPLLSSFLSAAPLPEIGAASFQPRLPAWPCEDCGLPTS